MERVMVIVDDDFVDLPRISSRSLPGRSSEEVRPQPPVAISWKQQAQRLHKEAHVFYFVFKHPRTRWYTRCVAACSAGYLLSPVQLIPSFIPLIGFLDDFLILFLGAKVIRKLTPPDVLAECRELADAAETRRKEEIRSMAAMVSSVVVTTVWIGGAVIASVLIVAYFRH
jgi:uncharacterized membrane protein YkvA (DUF1232 family)